eukprot:12408568-Karenia_brevis.AAC.1
MVIVVVILILIVVVIIIVIVIVIVIVIFIVIVIIIDMGALHSIYIMWSRVLVSVPACHYLLSVHPRRSGVVMA